MIAGPRPRLRAALAGVVRLTHPFPSLLDGLVTLVLALAAGAPAARALTLGLAMVSLQASIGALNDLVDIERDRDRKTGKPLPRGLVGEGTARAVVIAGLGIGLVLSGLMGAAVLAVAVAGVAVGYLYDLRLKASVWAWLPFAIGIPLLPVYAWVGATGRIPPGFLVVVPIAILAGGAIALLNGLVDVDRDRAAGTVTPVTRLGPTRARRVAILLLGTVVVGVGGTLVLTGAAPAAWLAAGAGSVLVAAGTRLAGSGHPGTRERGWEAGAVGLGLLATGCAIGLAGAGLL